MYRLDSEPDSLLDLCDFRPRFPFLNDFESPLTITITITVGDERSPQFSRVKEYSLTRDDLTIIRWDEFERRRLVEASFIEPRQAVESAVDQYDYIRINIRIGIGREAIELFECGRVDASVDDDGVPARRYAGDDLVVVEVLAAALGVIIVSYIDVFSDAPLFPGCDMR